MKTKSQQPHTQPVLFRVSDRVAFSFGTHRLVGTIVEDRGHLGVGGRRLLRIEAPFAESTLVTEMPEEELEPA